MKLWKGIEVPWSFSKCFAAASQGKFWPGFPGTKARASEWKNFEFSNTPATLFKLSSLTNPELSVASTKNSPVQSTHQMLMNLELHPKARTLWHISTKCWCEGCQTTSNVLGPLPLWAPPVNSHMTPCGKGFLAWQSSNGFKTYDKSNQTRQWKKTHSSIMFNYFPSQPCLTTER